MVDYDPFDERILDEPFDTFKRLRDQAPVYYREDLDTWFLSRFGDCWDVLGEQDRLTSARGTTTTHLLTHQTPNAPNLSGYDGDEHTRVRGYFAPFFLPKAARALEQRALQLSTEAIDRVIDQGRADVVQDIGSYLSVRIVCGLLGIPIEDADQVMDWVNIYFEREPGHRGTTERGAAAAKELGLYLFGLAKRARKHGAPEGTVLEKLLTTELEGQPVDDRQIAIHLNMMAIGGTETFPKVFSATLYRLWQNKDQRARAIADPSLHRWAFHEALRYDMPTQMLGRTVKDDFELQGEKLRAGSGLMFLWGSANRDEREFENPDVFDIDRKAPRILSFGSGQHMCLGAHIARMEGRVLLGEVLRRMPDYEVDETGIERLTSEFFRGFWRLPITFAA